MSHRIKARAPSAVAAPSIHSGPDIVSAFLDDAAHVPGGHAAGVVFPRDEADVAACVATATRLLAVGAQSSLTGGATPRGGTVLSTRNLRTIGVPAEGRVRAGAGVPIVELQRALAPEGWFFPPAPTFEGAFVGGTIATNAAGPATFKYGSTRSWVDAITVALADGSLLDVSRGATTAAAGRIEIESPTGSIIEVRLPTYTMPAVQKLSAGYVSGASADAIDLFIGSEGTLGVIVEATLRLARRRLRTIVLLECRHDEEALAVTTALRREARSAWRRLGPLDVAAVEYIDARALAVVPAHVMAAAGLTRPDDTGAWLLVQIETDDAPDDALARLQEILDECGVAGSPRIALPGDERGAARLLEVREAVPAAVNALVGAAKAADSRVEKTAGDMIVPFEQSAAAIAAFRDAFERRGLRYAIWGHLSDGNLHPNVIPASFADVERGRDALFEMAGVVTRLGGAPLAEHGVGRNALKQRLLRDLYGEAGIEEMRAVKRSLDPQWKLAPGVLFRA